MLEELKKESLEEFKKNATIGTPEDSLPYQEKLEREIDDNIEIFIRDNENINPFQNMFAVIVNYNIYFTDSFRFSCNWIFNQDCS